MNGDKFPINSQEVYFLTLVVSIGLYVVVSLLTSRKGRVCDMDRLLHRGRYRIEGMAVEEKPWSWRSLLPGLLGITPEYTRGDRVLAWSVFLWSFGWGFMVCFLGVLILNLIRPWGEEGFSRWFYFNNVLVAGAVGLVSTVWFTLGGTRDLRRLFVDLERRKVDVSDDGRVTQDMMKKQGPEIDAPV